MSTPQTDRKSSPRLVTETLQSLCYEMINDPYIYPRESMYQAFLYHGLMQRLGNIYTINTEYASSQGLRMDIVLRIGDNIIYILELKCLSITGDNILYTGRGPKNKPGPISQLATYMGRTKCKQGFLINFPKVMLSRDEKITSMYRPHKLTKMAGVHILRFSTESYSEFKITNDSFYIEKSTANVLTYNGLQFYKFIEPTVVCASSYYDMQERNLEYANYFQNGSNESLHKFRKSMLFNPPKASLVIGNTEMGKIFEDAIIERNQSQCDIYLDIKVEERIEDKLVVAITKKKETERKLLTIINGENKDERRLEHKIEVKDVIKNSTREHMMPICGTIGIIITKIFILRDLESDIF